MIFLNVIYMETKALNKVVNCNWEWLFWDNTIT